MPVTAPSFSSEQMIARRNILNWLEYSDAPIFQVRRPAGTAKTTLSVEFANLKCAAALCRAKRETDEPRSHVARSGARLGSLSVPVAGTRPENAVDRATLPQCHARPRDDRRVVAPLAGGARRLCYRARKPSRCLGHRRHKILAPMALIRSRISAIGCSGYALGAHPERWRTPLFHRTRAYRNPQRSRSPWPRHRARPRLAGHWRLFDPAEPRQRLSLGSGLQSRHRAIGAGSGGPVASLCRGH